MIIGLRQLSWCTGFCSYQQVQHWNGYLFEQTLSASSYFRPNQCSGQVTKWIPSVQKWSILSYFQLLLTPVTSHGFHINLKSSGRMWRSWDFVFSLEDCRRSRGRVGGWGGWSGVLSNELYKMGTAKLKWEETDLPPNMNTRKMQMYQQWIYYSEYVGKQKALESRENENELLPSAPCCRRKNERKSGEKEKERMVKREIRGWGGMKKAGNREEKKSWALFRLFFFLSNGILCSWMCRCYGNCNLVTSLFLPNPTLKLWLLHPFAWLPW